MPLNADSDNSVFATNPDAQRTKEATPAPKAIADFCMKVKKVKGRPSALMPVFQCPYSIVSGTIPHWQMEQNIIDADPTIESPINKLYTSVVGIGIKCLPTLAKNTIKLPEIKMFFLPNFAVKIGVSTTPIIFAGSIHWKNTVSKDSAPTTYLK